MNEQPLVSVVVLSFNHEKFIERSLLSVIHQTYTNFQIIYIDNCSSDGSFEKGVRVLEQSTVNFSAEKMIQNLGTARGVNYAIRKFAIGEYIAPHAGDDWLDMDCLKDKVEYFQNNPDYGMVYGNGYNFNNESAEMDLYYKKPSISGWIFKDLLKAPRINPLGILYKNSLLKELGYFDEDCKVEDRELWFRIAKVAPVGYVHKPGTYYRVNHQGNISRNLAYMKEGNEYIFKMYEKEFPEEIKAARLRQYQYFAGFLATSEPSIDSIKFILKNYHFDWLYTKQIIKCALNIIKRKVNLK